MEETLTQRSRRREAGQLAITMLKVAIIKACHQGYWRDGAFYSIKHHSSDVDIDLERLEESSRTTEAEKAIFRATRAKVADVRAYLGGRPPKDWSSVDDLGWVRRLKGVFEGEVGEGREAGEASNAQKGGTKTKAAASVEDDGDGFETQRVYGGSGGPPKR